MRGAYKIVSKILEELPPGSITNIIDVGLALGMQIPWTYEISQKYNSSLYSVDINLKNFFQKSIHKYLPPKNCDWNYYQKTTACFDEGYNPKVENPLSWHDLQLNNVDPPVYDYGVENHFLVHSHSTKFLRWFPEDIDILMVDGDHRYVTVWNDLNVFREKNGKVAFFDDIDTIFARNEATMEDYLNRPGCEISFEGASWKVKGPGGTYFSEILDGASENYEQIGIKEFELALGQEEKRGVLTAVEDFVKKYPEYRFDIYKTGAG